MKRIGKLSFFELFLMLCGGVILLYIAAPIISMMLDVKFHELYKTAIEQEVYSSIYLTLWTSILATFVLSLAAVPFAYFLARHEFPFKRILCGIIDIPIVIPHSAAGIAILGVISRDSIFGKFTNKLGINFVDHPLGIMVAMAFVSLPFLINGAREGFEAVPINLEKSALTLGNSKRKVFFRISLPLAWRSVLSGFVMMWARGLSEFGAVIIIAYHPMVTSVLIYDRFNNFGLKYAQSVSVLFIIVCLIVFIFFRILSDVKRLPLSIRR